MNWKDEDGNIMPSNREEIEGKTPADLDVAAEEIKASAIIQSNGCWYRKKNPRLDIYPAVRLTGRVIRISRLLLSVKHKRELGRLEFACHICDVAACINPAHLFLGSPSDNMIDCAEKKRNKQTMKTHCRRGHKFDGVSVRSETGRIRRTCSTCKNINSLKSHHNTKERRNAYSRWYHHNVRVRTRNKPRNSRVP